MSGVPGPKRQPNFGEGVGSSHSLSSRGNLPPDPEVICLSSSEDDDDEVEVIDPAVAAGPGARSRFVPREVMIQKHPWCRDLSFKDIMTRTVLLEKFLPDFDEQVLSEEVRDKIRVSGYDVQKSSGGDGGPLISTPSMGGSHSAAVTMYYSSFSKRLEPTLEDPVLENYVQEYRKTIPVPGGGQAGHPGGSAKSTPNEDDELLQGTVSAWVIPNPRGNLIRNANATPSAAGFGGPHPSFTNGRSYPGTHSSFEGQGHPKKKLKPKQGDPDRGESEAGPGLLSRNGVWNFHESSGVQSSGSSAVLPGGHGGGSRSHKPWHSSEG